MPNVAMKIKKNTTQITNIDIRARFSPQTTSIEQLFIYLFGRWRFSRNFILKRCDILLQVRSQCAEWSQFAVDYFYL